MVLSKSLTILEKYYEDGLLMKQVHPTLDLTIWNYTQQVQYEKNLWDEITKSCRGLVTDDEGNIVARPFKKFFNWEELTADQIPNESFEITEKVDGSLGIVFYYANQWILASRGSFTSEQAVKGNEMLLKYNIENGLIPGWTYLMEIIYPENRIVCNYGDAEKLVVITAIETATGREGSIDEMVNEGFHVVRTLNGVNDFNDIKTMISDDEEGYVVRFKSGFRMKIKGEEYIRLHRIITNISNRDIWQLLKDGKPLTEILEKVPDEFYSWVRDTETNLTAQFNNIKNDVELVFRELVNKKEYAEKVKDMNIKHLLFRRLDSYSKQYEDMIWDRIYPAYSKPFKNDVDNG